MTGDDYTVLVIDDNPADAGVLRRHLNRVEGRHLEVVHAPDSRTGNDVIARQNVDCVILDYELGGTNGIDVLKSLRESGNDVPVIAFTGAGSETVAVNAMKEGAQDYLVKGRVDGPALYKAVLNAIEKVSLARRVRAQEEELASFVGMVSHDLKSPLRHIGHCCERLEEAASLDEECRSEVSMIRSSQKRMRALIDRLLEYTCVCRARPNLEPVDLGEVVADVVMDLSAVIDEARARIDVATLPVVMGDPVRLRQVFQNIIGNGIKYNQSDAPVIHVNAQRCGDEWRVEVADNGIGIAPQYRREVFKPFKRLHSSSEYEGSGLGLATAQRVVQQHGGRIWVTSQPGVGSTFHITLPPVHEDSRLHAPR